MSATTAAQAMLDHDANLAGIAAELDLVPADDIAARTATVILVLSRAKGLPSLAFAADAAAVTKRQVLEELVLHPRLRVAGEPLPQHSIASILGAP